MPESSEILNDLNKVFIPCRAVLEMEALTSLFLEHYNYDLIKEIPQSQPESQKVIKIFLCVISRNFSTSNYFKSFDIEDFIRFLCKVDMTF